MLLLVFESQIHSSNTLVWIYDQKPSESTYEKSPQEYIDEAKQQRSEASEKLAMVDSKIEQTKQLQNN